MPTKEILSMSRENAKAKALLEAEGIDTMEATENLLEAMLDRAAEFTIASREEAVRALEDAMVGTSALAGALLALTGTKDEAARDALIKASKEACNATMQTMRAITYLKARDDGAEQADRDEDDTEKEERLFSHRIDRAIDEAKSRAKATAPRSAEEAADNLYDVVNDVATALVAMRLYEDVDAEYYGDLFDSTLTNAARALHYLNGGTFADRDYENATTDGESLEGIPYVEVGYADGSSMRTVGHFDRHTVADVAHLITLTTAPTEEEEE